MKVDKSILRDTVEQFTDTILRKDQPKNLCFSLSWPLLHYLEIKGIKCKLSSGSYGDFRHFWLTLIDSTDTIIDVTRSQFDDYDGGIYIGPLDEKFYFIEKAEFREVFFYAYKSWSELLLGNKKSHELILEDELRVSQINVKCAALLYETMTFHQKLLCFDDRYSLDTKYFTLIERHLTLKRVTAPKYIQSFIDNQAVGFEQMAIDFGIMRIVDGHYLY